MVRKRREGKRERGNKWITLTEVLIGEGENIQLGMDPSSPDSLQASVTLNLLNETENPGFPLNQSQRTRGFSLNLLSEMGYS